MTLFRFMEVKKLKPALVGEGLREDCTGEHKAERLMLMSMGLITY